MRPATPPLALLAGSATAPAVVSALVTALADGRVADGDVLPSTRTLATHLGCSRGVVVRAYDELAASGYVEGVPGSGTRVVAGAGRAARSGATTRVDVEDGVVRSPGPQGTPDSRISLRPGKPDADLVVTKDWRRAWRTAAADPVEDRLPWEVGSSGRLHPALRDHLRRHRGINARDLVLVQGASAGLTALAAAAGLPLVVEDPGYTGARRAFDLAGVDVESGRIDEAGLVVDELPEARRMVYVTPAHQYPLGVRLSVERRVDLLAWAHRTGSFIIEDDYDGEFRYGVAPMPALRSLPGAEGVVAFVGTASKVLVPSLQVAWVVPPEPLVEAVEDEVVRRRCGAAAMPASALGAFISLGALDRHISRASRTYAARRRALLGALGEQAPTAQVSGVEAGLHARLVLPPGTDREVVLALAERGHLAEAVSASSVASQESGLLLGYACLPESRAPAAAAAIVDACRAVLGKDWGR